MMGASKTGWVLTGLVGTFMILASASGKFLVPAPPMVAETATHLGWPLERYPLLGALEVGVTLLVLVPRTSFVGTILLTGYLGGACATHARIGDPSGAMPVVLGVLAWVGWGLRNPAALRAALGGASAATRNEGNPVLPNES